MSSFSVVDDRNAMLSILCECERLDGGKIAWRALAFGHGVLRGCLDGVCVDEDAVMGHVQAEILERGIFAREPSP